MSVLRPGANWSLSLACTLLSFRVLFYFILFFSLNASRRERSALSWPGGHSRKFGKFSKIKAMKFYEIPRKTNVTTSVILQMQSSFLNYIHFFLEL